MANNNENNISDEDYLDSLLNSVVGSEDEQLGANEDFDVVSEEDLFDFGDLSFDDLLEESLQNELDPLEEEDAANLALDNQQDSDKEDNIDNNETEDITESIGYNGPEDIVESVGYNEPEDIAENIEENNQNNEEDDVQSLFDSIGSEFESVEESDSNTTDDGSSLLLEEDLESLFSDINLEESEEETETRDNSDDMDELDKMLNELSGNSDDSEQQEQNKTEEEKTEEKAEKKGFLSKIFGKKNKKADKEEKEKNDSELIPFDELDLSDIEDRTEELEKEKAKKEKAEAKAKKAQERKEKRAQAKAEREEKARKKKAEKEKKVKPPAEMIYISKPVYLLIVTFVAGIGLLVYFGSVTISYTTDMKSAVKAFVKDDYSKAYDYVAGMDIKSEDENFYNQVVTIMYVEKQLLSYNNYRKVEDYNRALDSLLKGIVKYDKYKSKAQELEVLEDFKVSYNRILTALKYDYKLSEEEAREIVDILSEEEYSDKIRNVVKDNLFVIEENIANENKEKATK